ncbi:hypothetical protein ALTERO38_51897 [Alteromonas sp. 38]|nr:hypothetical protein ALTER154_50332 [Alteromonas sp. 154]VXB91622.1 hypothetical protein ALTERO38_51897 [Alteromonas sp. 38]
MPYVPAPVIEKLCFEWMPDEISLYICSFRECSLHVVGC